MRQTKLNLFNYTDFRKFLRDRLVELKRLDRKYSLRYLSDKIGLSSKSHLKMVADGSRNLSPDLGRKVAKAIGLNEEETSFFLALMRYGQAKGLDEQRSALDDLRRKRKFIDVHKMELDHFDYLTDPVALTIREMVSFPGFREDSEWIREQLPSRVSEKKIVETIDNLVRLGVLDRDADGKLSTNNPHQATGDGLQSMTLKSFYEKSYKRAVESIKQPRDQRHLGGLTMAISEEGYDRVVDRYREFVNDVRAIADSESDSDRVYQMVMGLFPLTKLK